MRTLFALSIAGCLTLAGIAACGDNTINPTAPSSTMVQQTLGAAPTTLDGEIRSTINSLFLARDVEAATSKWDKIIDEIEEARIPGLKPKKTLSENDKARRMLATMIAYVQKKTPKLTPPAGETKEHAAARLVLLMSLYVYGGPDTAIPVISRSSDMVLAVVQPSATATTTIRTPLQHAAVQFPPGSLGETRIVVISQETVPYPENCSGPLETSLCQYPQFYKFNVFPDKRLLTPAIAAVCHINSGTARAPLGEGDHDHYAIAHDAPANPADRVEEGQIVEGIEILPFVRVFGLTSCEGNSYQVGLAPVAPRGPLGRAMQWVAEPMQRVASAILSQFTPREAWAVDGLGGGYLRVFSTIATVDPQGRPDLAVIAEPSAPEGSVVSGDNLLIGNWVVANQGKATATGVSVAAQFGTDSLFTTGVIASVPLSSAASLAPGAQLSGSEASIAVPYEIANGIYYVGVHATISNEGGLHDPNIYNNRKTVRIVVRNGG